MTKTCRLNGLEMDKEVIRRGHQGRIFFLPNKYISKLGLEKVATWNLHGKSLIALSEDTYTRSFLIESGTMHAIACSIKKIKGHVVSVLSMDSLRSKLFKVFGSVAKFFGASTITEEDAIKTVLDWAKSRRVAQLADIYQRYSLLLRFARALSDSLYVTDLTSDFTLAQYSPDALLEDRLITDFVSKFEDYLDTISSESNWAKNIMVGHMKNSDGSRKYLNKMEFLQLISPGSNWWGNANLKQA